MLEQHPDTSSEWLHARARLLITRAFSEFEIHGLERGKPAAAEAAEAASAADRAARDNRRDLAALVHELNGVIALRSGRLDDALVECNEAVALLADLDPDDRPTLLLNRGAVHLLRRDLRAARADLSASARFASELGMTRQEFKAQHNLGYAEFLAGDIPAALRAFALADELDTDVSRSVWFLDRARVLMEAGLLEEADQALARASELLRRERANQDRAEAELVRAEVALLQGDWSVAKTRSARARREFRRRQSVGWQARADVTRWQAYLDTKGGPARVAREIRDAVAKSGHTTMDHQLALIAAEADLALGYVDKAGGLLQRTSTGTAKDPLSARLHHHLVRAGVARAAGDVPAARRELRTGLGVLASQQARHHSLDLRTAMAVHGGRLAELDLRMALESGSAGTVFNSLERWRAMSHRRSAVRPPRDEELADLLAGLRITTEEIRNTPPGQPVEHLRRRQRGYERAVREREWTLSGGGRAERSTTLAKVRPVLARMNSDAVAYFVLDHRLGAVTVVRGRPRVVILGPWSDAMGLMTRIRADLDALAGRLLPSALRQTISSSLGHDLNKLDRLLLPDDVGESGSLLVVPSRTLATAAWSLLPRRVGRPTTVALSATSWLRGHTDAVSAPRVSALAGPGLALSGPEVENVAASWPEGVATSSEHGSASGLATALVTSDLVHIAAHGVHNHDNPLFSSIRMADGPLYAYDVPSDEPVAGHVVLSACDLGLTTPRAGGEVLGLTAALLSIGTRSVVSSVSRVDDTTAYETMLRYHRLLAGGLDSPTALAEALDGDVDLPAPFVCFGSPWSVAS
jgi:tetratricopeptide (TPR) repeat protein